MYYIATTNNKQYLPTKPLFTFYTDLSEVLYHAVQHNVYAVQYNLIYT